MKIAVRCPTKEIWEQAIAIVREPKMRYTPKDIGQSTLCIDIVDGSWDHDSYFLKTGYKVISFEEWQGTTEPAYEIY